MAWPRRPKRDPDMRETSVYRLYDKRDSLLYVGVSVDPFARLDTHWRKQPWWSEVDHVIIEWFACRQDALDEELRVIRENIPAYNMQGCGGPGQRRATPARPEPVRPPIALVWVGGP